jgi:photosystem II stability/assembly factor-like uncharacterized protein
MMRFPFLLALAALVSTAGAQTIGPELYRELHWRCIGPFRGGRTRAATGVPGHPNLFYVAQVNGGVWKSDDYGRTWIPIFDDQPTQSIGALAVAPSAANTIYAASGEGLARPDLSVGNGIYRSTDAGKTWTHLGLRDGQQIPAIIVDPRDARHLYSAVLGHPYGPNAERGVFESADGGETWTKSLYVDENTGGSDVVFDPSDPNVIYASLWEVRQGPWEFGNEYTGSHGGLFKSTDAGKSWTKLTQGLPGGVAQIYVAIAPSNPKRIYASLGTDKDQGIYRSDDGGESWTRTTTDTRPSQRIGGGDLAVPKVDPKNPDVVYSTSTVTWRSEDAGKTWTGIKGAPGGDDYQNIWINPDNPDIILLVSDQGAAVSVNRGRTWSSWYNQPTAQLYHAIADNGFPYRVCGGQQESGSVCISSRGNDGAITFREWHPAGVIEYGYVAPDPLDPDTIYGAGRGSVTKFHWNTGQVEMITPSPLRDPQYRADRTSPILFSPIDPHTLYYASSVLFKTTDAGHNWSIVSPDLTRPHPGIPASLGTMAAKDPGAEKQRGVIYSLAPSFKNINTIWAGTDEGLLWVTRDAGKNWKDITPPELTPWSKVTQLEASHFDDMSAYASVSRFRVDDLKPYIYRTHDGGKTWKLITEGLPDSPIDTVREDPVRKGLLFAGSETSVWVSFDDGGHWQSLQNNLPHTSMRDLWIHGNDLIVGTHGRSFWILDDITPLRQIGEKIPASDAWLAKPGQAIRVKRNTYTDTPLPPDEPMGENPPDGAVIDYYVGSQVSGPVTLEILNAQGKLVRRYSSADKPEVTDEDLKAIVIPRYWVRLPRVLSAEAGMHRWVWDLRYAAPESLRHEYPISANPHDTPRLPLGPSVTPGTYTVKLTVNGKSYTAPLAVKMDPRVKTAPSGLAQQFDLASKLSAIMTRTTNTIREVRSVQEQIEKLPHTPALEGLEKKVKAVNLGPASFQVGMLYNDLESADVAPTAAQLAAVPKLAGTVAAEIDRWNTLKKKDLAAMPEIRIEKALQPAVDDQEDDLE